MSAREPDLALPVATGQALLDYLISQPYRDVYQLVAALQTLERVPADSDENAP
jgi:hypothetical protein